MKVFRVKEYAKNMKDSGLGEMALDAIINGWPMKLEGLTKKEIEAKGYCSSYLWLEEGVNEYENR